MVLQNKHKQLASRRWNKARGNPVKKQEDRSGRFGRPGGAPGAVGVNDSGSGNEESGSGREDDDDESEAEEFPDLPSAGGPASHMKPPVSRVRPAQAPVDPKFARRQLKSNADRYDEPEPDPYEEGPVEPTSDEEREAHARAVLEQHRMRPARSSDDEKDGHSSDDEDVDHELLARLASSRLGGGSRGRGGIRRPKPARPVKVDLDDEEDVEAMALMKLEKEKADAVADVKARLLGNRFAEAPPRLDRSVRLAYGRRPADPPAIKQTMEADSVDDFLDSL